MEKLDEDLEKIEDGELDLDDEEVDEAEEREPSDEDDVTDGFRLPNSFSDN